MSDRDTSLPEKHRHRARFVYRGPRQDEIDRIKKHQITPYFKAKLQERPGKAEGLFGEAKERHCLRRAKYRGLRKMQMQVYLTPSCGTANGWTAVFMHSSLPSIRPCPASLPAIADFCPVEGVAGCENGGFSTAR